MSFEYEIFGFPSFFQKKHLLRFALANRNAIPPLGGSFEPSGKKDLIVALADLKSKGEQKEIEFILRSFLASNGNMADIGMPGAGFTRLTNLNNKIIESLQKNGLLTAGIQNALPVNIAEVVDILVREVEYITPDDLAQIKLGITNRINNPSPRDLRRMSILEQRIARGGQGSGYAAIELDDYRNGRRGSVPIPGSARKRYASGRGFYWEVFDGTALGGDQQLVSIDPNSGLGAGASMGAWRRSSDFQPVDFSRIRKAQEQESNIVFTNPITGHQYTQQEYDNLRIMKGWKRSVVDDARRVRNRHAAALLADMGGNYDPFTGSVKFGDLEYAREEAKKAVTRADRLNKAGSGVALHQQTMMNFEAQTVLRNNRGKLDMIAGIFGDNVARKSGGTVRLGNGPGTERVAIKLVPRFEQVMPNGSFEEVRSKNPESLSLLDVTNAIEANGVTYFRVKEVDYVVTDLTTGIDHKFRSEDEAAEFAASILEDKDRVSEDELLSGLDVDAKVFEYKSSELYANVASKFSRCKCPTLDLHTVTTMDPAAFKALGSALPFSRVQELVIDGGTLFSSPGNFRELQSCVKNGKRIYLENDTCPATLNTQTVRDITAAIGAGSLDDTIVGLPQALKDQIDEYRIQQGLFTPEFRDRASVGRDDTDSPVYIFAALRPKWEALIGTNNVVPMRVFRENDSEVFYRVKIGGAEGFAHLSKTADTSKNFLATMDEVRSWIEAARTEMRTNPGNFNEAQTLVINASDETFTPLWMSQINGSMHNFELIQEIKVIAGM